MTKDVKGIVRNVIALIILTGSAIHAATAQQLWSFNLDSAGQSALTPLNSATASNPAPITLDRSALETFLAGDSAILSFSEDLRFPLQFQEFNIYPNGDLSWNSKYTNEQGQSYSASFMLGQTHFVGDIQSDNGLYRVTGKRVSDSEQYVGWFYKHDDSEVSIKFEGTPRVIRSDSSAIRAPIASLHPDASQLTTQQISDASLRITVTAPQPSYFIGDDIPVTVSFENISAEAHTALQATLFFDADNPNVSALSPACVLVPDSPALADCNLGDFAAGETKTVSYTVNNIAEGTFPNVWLVAQVGQASGSIEIPFGADYLADTDGDGLSDFNEKLVGTDPMNNQSTFNETLVIDVLSVYTDDASTPGSNDHETLINQLFNVTNQAYLDSGIAMRIRPVGMVNLNGYKPVNMDSALTDISTGDNPGTANIASLRSQYGGDMVTIFMGEAENCGLAFVGGGGANGNFNNNAGTMYAAVSTTEGCFPTIPLTHELGHNFGMNHSRKQDGTGGTYHFSLGHGVDGKFVTVMAYSFEFDTTNKMRIFSSPGLTCVDEPCGVDSNDTTNGADSVKTINAIMFQVANFYEQRPEKTFVSAANGQASATQQLGGIYKTGANKFNETYTTADELFLTAEIQLDPAHVGRMGELIAVIEMPNIGLLQLNQQGQFEAWDGGLATLKAATATKSLQATETFSVFNQWPVSTLGRTQLQVNVYTAYRLLDSNELFYTNAPLQFSVSD